MNQQVIYPHYLDKRQVAKLIGCGVRTVDRMRERGFLRAIVLSSSMLRFELSDVQKAMDRLKESPEPAPHDHPEVRG